MATAEKILDLQFIDYTHGKSARKLGRNEIFEDLKSWFAEALVVPNGYETTYENGQWVDRNGTSMVSMAELALFEAQGSKVEDRFRAELRGVERMEELIGEAENGDVVLLMSPPGSVEEGFGKGGRRLSFSYIGVVAKKLNGKKVTMYAVPEDEVLPREHLDKFVELLSRGDKVNVKSELSDRFLVSEPFVLKRGSGGFNKFAKKLGYENFSQLISRSKAINERRVKLISHTTDVVQSAVENNEVEVLTSLNDVVRKVYALESAGQLDDLNDHELIQMFNAYLSEVVEIMEMERSSYLAGVDAVPAVVIDGNRYILVMEMQRRLVSSSYAREILSGGSCPTDQGLGLMLTFGRMGEFEGMNLINPLVIQSPLMLSIISGSVESSSGMNGEKQCYKCPKCKGDPPQGDVYKESGYLVCSKKPKEHRLKI